MNDRIERAEEELAHLRKTVDELSDVLAAQGREIARMSRLLGLLMEREAEREFAAGGAIPLADQKPPHW
ncbi:SlyX family protein [Rhodobacter capsulatus]|nr:SlyX family protein [Rhodobacter capsulatus]WER10213.1 SlyX family protein [Rhodobacter capsulatus]